MADRRQEGPSKHDSVVVRPDSSFAARIIDAQDNERRKISRELHDSVGQSLVAVKMSIAKCQRENSLHDNSELNEALRMLDSTISEIRTLSHLLHPPNLELLGLQSSLAWLVEGFQQRSGIEARLEAPDKFPEFPPPATTAIFRVAQEALANTHRHAGASHVVVRVTTTPEEFQLEISDDGKGFADLKACRQGVGILGMQERLAELGGSLRVESARDAGSSVFAIIPLGAEELPPAPTPSQGYSDEGVGRILVVDDHPAIRSGVCAILSACPDLEVCGEASTVDEAVKLVGDLRPDVVLLDLRLRQENGWAVVRKMRVLNSPAKIIVFSHFEQGFISTAAKNAGCAGYVCKSQASEELIDTIRAVLRGRAFFGPAFSA